MILPCCLFVAKTTELTFRLIDHVSQVFAIPGVVVQVWRFFFVVLKQLFLDGNLVSNTSNVFFSIVPLCHLFLRGFLIIFFKILPDPGAQHNVSFPVCPALPCPFFGANPPCQGRFRGWLPPRHLPLKSGPLYFQSEKIPQ